MRKTATGDHPGIPGARRSSLAVLGAIPPSTAEPVADAPLRPGDANLDAGTPLDAESLVADRELLRVEPIAGSPPGASAGNRLISALLLVIALVGFALIVLRGGRGVSSAATIPSSFTA
ncbi:MAG: hypothetical protein U0166_13670 [Acidobacteriota bacterium]